MFRARLSLIIRSIWTVFTASGIIYARRCRPATTRVHNTRGCKYSLDAPDDERKYRSKHVEQPRNNKLSYTVASCWSFSYIISWCTEPWISTSLSRNTEICVWK